MIRKLKEKYREIRDKVFFISEQLAELNDKMNCAQAIGANSNDGGGYNLNVRLLNISLAR